MGTPGKRDSVRLSLLIALWGDSDPWHHDRPQRDPFLGIGTEGSRG